MRGKEDVWKDVERFRAEWPAELNALPVDILSTVEIRLRLNVVPFQDLNKKYSVEAAILPDFSGIYVDKRSYSGLEGTPTWLFNRLRFSLAHELGHFVLHRGLAPREGFGSLEEFWNWMRSYQRDRYDLEQQANEFAGRLLVPVARLEADYDAFAAKAKDAFPEFWNDTKLREALCEKLADKYAVNPTVIGCRLDRDEIWPSP